jgi:hypothetical protein
MEIDAPARPASWEQLLSFVLSVFDVPAEVFEGRENGKIVQSKDKR